MLIEIKNRFTGAIILCGEYESVKDCLQKNSAADLRFADLRSANLRYADLSSANLRYANLSYANLRYANLRYAIGEMRSLRSFQIEKYMVSYTDSILNIGCQSHTIEEWENFDDDRIKSMDSGALEWWTKWKPIIFQIIEMSPAKPTGYVEKEEL